MRREASLDVIPKPTITFNPFINKPAYKQLRQVVSHSVMSPSRARSIMADKANNSKNTVNHSSIWKTNNGHNHTQGSILGGLHASSLLSQEDFMQRSKMNASTMSS